MTHNYIKITKTIITAIVLLIGLVTYSQNIQFTFENATNTNDGSYDYYEADIMIQTIDGQADFKLGSGQIYFNYNTAAFGTNVDANSGFEVTADFASGYFLGEVSGFTNFYDITTINDNTSSRVSWSFSQVLSSGAMTEIVSTTPKKMIHVKFKYVDVNETPMVAFEDDESLVTGSRDQFYTACGPYDSASSTLDCTGDVDAQNINVQFFDAMFDSSGATLSNEDFKLLTGLSLYPNPTSGILYINGDISKLKDVNIYSITGQHVMEVKDNFREIDISKLDSALYFVKLNTEKGTGTIKIIKQ